MMHNQEENRVGIILNQFGYDYIQKVFGTTHSDGNNLWFNLPHSSNVDWVEIKPVQDGLYQLSFMSYSSNDKLLLKKRYEGVYLEDLFLLFTSHVRFKETNKGTKV